MKTAVLHSSIHRTILPVSTVELKRMFQSLVSEKNLTLGSAPKVIATGTNLTPQHAIETLFRGKRGGGATDGTRTRNSQYHKLELYH
jgi:hypothetical protein